MKPDNQYPIQAVSKVSDAQKKQLIGACMRSRDCFDAVRPILAQVLSWSSEDRPWGFLWQTLVDCVDLYQDIPEADILEATMRQSASETSDIADYESDMLSDYIQEVFTAPPRKYGKQHVLWVTNVATYWAHDQLAAFAQNAVLGDDPDKRPADLQKQLQTVLEAHNAISAAATSEIKPVFESGWDLVLALKTTPSGIPFIDNFTGGGLAENEVYGLAGPTGSCKTTIAVQLTAKAVMQYAADPQDDRVVFYLSYEMNPTEFRRRLLSASAYIPRSTTDKMTRFDDLRGPGDYSPDELREFAQLRKAGQYVPCERERADAVIAKMNKHVAFQFMAEFSAPGAGKDPVGEIVQFIHSYCRKTRKRPGLVIIDYLTAMLIRAGVDTESSKFSTEMKAYVLRISNQIAAAFHVPVWVLLQVNAEGNAANPTAVPNPTNIAGSKLVMENMDFCFMLGTIQPARDGNPALLVVHKTKQRRTERQDGIPVILDGNYARVLPADAYKVNKTRKCICRKDEDGYYPSSMRDEADDVFEADMDR